jgi:hypothetical protein
MRSGYKILSEKPERERPLGRHRHRWEGNIKMECEVWSGVILFRRCCGRGLPCTAVNIRVL